MGCFNDPAWTTTTRRVCVWWVVGGVADTNYLYPACWGWIKNNVSLTCSVLNPVNTANLSLQRLLLLQFSDRQELVLDGQEPWVTFNGSKKSDNLAKYNRGIWIYNKFNLSKEAFFILAVIPLFWKIKFHNKVGYFPWPIQEYCCIFM